MNYKTLQKFSITVKSVGYPQTFAEDESIKVTILYEKKFTPKNFVRIKIWFASNVIESCYENKFFFLEIFKLFSIRKFL